VYMVYCKGHMSFDCAACPFMEKKHVRGGGGRAPWLPVHIMSMIVYS
jgi:hypothetical protein